MLTRRPLLASLLAAAATRQSRAAEASWTIATEYPRTAMPGEGVAHFATAATRLAAGALTVTPGFDAPNGLRSAAMLRAASRRRMPSLARSEARPRSSSSLPCPS